MDYHYKAVSISSVIRNILSRQKYQGTIAGVYKRAVNISFGNHLITAIDISQKNLPYGILCDFSDIDLQSVLVSGDAAEIEPESLFIKDRFFEISLNSASIWSPEFYMPIHRGEISVIQRNIDRIKQQIIQENNSEGLVPLFRYLPNLLDTKASGIEDSAILTQRAFEPLRTIINAIRNFDESLIINEFKKLTGLGSGLTPSGDDILAGLFATLIITSKAADKKWFTSILEKILPQIEGLTNDVSLNYHKAVSQGYFPERVSTLISAIISAENFLDVQPALQDMFEWGQTSGYEIIFGMVIGFSLAVEKIKS